jgi:hypothetical protein
VGEWGNFTVLVRRWIPMPYTQLKSNLVLYIFSPSPHPPILRQLSGAWQTLNQFLCQREREPAFHNAAHVQLVPPPLVQGYRVIA